MAVLSMLLLAEPSGFWENIIKAFEGFTNNYVLAIILLTVIIRIIWAPIDTLNKRMSQKMTAVQAKMQPELDKINKKYANDPKLLKQKQNELYSKYNGRSMGSCLFMLVFLALNITIFFTLFSGLNNMASFKINQSYEELKFDYVNALNLTNDYIATPENLDRFEDYQNLSFEKEIRDEKEYIVLYQNAGEEKTELFAQEYKTDFSTTQITQDPETGEDVTEVVQTTNAYITTILDKFFPIYEEGEVEGSKEIILIEDQPVLDEDGNPVLGENGQPLTDTLYLGEAFQDVAMRFVENTYQETKESFLWIENIWIADAPFQRSIFSYQTYQGQVGANNIEEGEERIYNTFMTDLSERQGRVNGYLILPLLCIAASFLSIWLSTRRKKGQSAQPATGGKFMKILMPVIFGLFALFYNSVFAIYMFVSQLISALLMPLENLIIDKWQKHTEKKEEKKVEVEYSRKF